MEVSQLEFMKALHAFGLERRQQRLEEKVEASEQAKEEAQKFVETPSNEAPGLGGKGLILSVAA